MLVLAIALAGAVGAPARYFVDAVVIDRSEGGLPLATFVINVSGCNRDPVPPARMTPFIARDRRCPPPPERAPT